MKGCVIGNSHAAAVIEGWSRLKQSETAFAFDFFAFPAICPDEICVENGQMRASSRMTEALVALGVKNRIVLRDYDFLMIVGCGLNLMLSARGVRRHCRISESGAPATLRDRLFRLAPAVFPAPRSLISEDCLHAARDALTEASVAIMLARRLHEATEIPVILAPEPLPSATILNAPDKGRYMRRLQEAGEGPSVRASMYQGIRRALADLPRATLLRHPDAVIEDEMFTPAAFGVNAQRLFDLRSTFGEDDFWHANGDYGEVLMRSMLAKIGEISGRS